MFIIPSQVHDLTYDKRSNFPPPHGLHRFDPETAENPILSVATGATHFDATPVSKVFLRVHAPFEVDCGVTIPTITIWRTEVAEYAGAEAISRLLRPLVAEWNLAPCANWTKFVWRAKAIAEDLS